jgi:hypothetical protein
MLSGQKRTLEECHSEENESLKNLCDLLKPLDLRSLVDQYSIPIKTTQFAVIDQRNALYSKPRCVIHLEDAPDGLPHLLMVDRTVKITHVIEKHLGASLNKLQESMGEEFSDHISSLERALHTKSAKAEIIDSFFLPDVQLNQILGPTVLARLLNGKSPRQQFLKSCNPQTAYQSSYPQTTLSSAYSPGYFPPSPIHISTSPAYAPVHIPSEGKDAQLAKRAWLDKQRNGVFLAINIGTPESHTILTNDVDLPVKETRECICYRRHPSIISPDELVDKVSSGIKFRREDTSSIGDVIIKQDYCLTAIAFDVRRILLGFATAAKILNRDYHKHGKIHCDLTPNNILVFSDAFVPIDSMDIPHGTVAPGGTLEWSAPEQILYRPVSDKTDVFSLALIVVALLGGSMFGQISEYVVASKAQNLGVKEYSLDIVKLLPTPELTFGRFETEHDNTGLELPIDQLKNTLRKCLQLDPLVRPTILELAASLSDFAYCVPVGPQCVETLRSGYGEGSLQCWNNNGIEEYFWKSSYTTNRIF